MGREREAVKKTRERVERECGEVGRRGERGKRSPNKVKSNMRKGGEGCVTVGQEAGHDRRHNVTEISFGLYFCLCVYDYTKMFLLNIRIFPARISVLYSVLPTTDYPIFSITNITKHNYSSCLIIMVLRLSPSSP